MSCPVFVLHGSTDGMIPVAYARHTAAIVPGARLRIVDGLGHISIMKRIVEVICELIPGTSSRSEKPFNDRGSASV